MQNLLRNYDFLGLYILHSTKYLTILMSNSVSIIMDYTLNATVAFATALTFLRIRYIIKEILLDSTASFNKTFTITEMNFG